MNNKSQKNTLKIFLKLALGLVLILILGLLFYRTWIDHYNQLLRFPYLFKGRLFVMFVYMILFYIFTIIYDCNNISNNQLSILIISEILSVVSCNVLMYFVVIIPTAATILLPFMPIIKLSLYDIIVVAAWSLVTNYALKKFFRAEKVLLISNEEEIESIIYKFSKRDDLYEIKETCSFDRRSIDDIYKKCDNFDTILIGDLKSEDRNDIIKYCFDNTKNFLLSPKISDILLKYSDDIFIFDVPLYYSQSYGLSIESRFFKRVIDIIISLIVIIVFLPVWIVFALLIKLEDGGPIFFLQERITYNLKKFNIIKFRSMKVASDSVVVPTTENDPRITKIGNVIRKLHIDEIPQFINVLIGDMSVVGPRPERIEHVHLYEKDIPEFLYRYKVKSGITGLAQIYGKYNTSAINKLKLDLIYIKKYSPLFDLELIIKTLKVLFIKDNTEGFDEKNIKYISQNAK